MLLTMVKQIYIYIYFLNALATLPCIHTKPYVHIFLIYKENK